MDGRPGGSERFPTQPLLPRDVSPHRRESAPAGAPGPGHLLAASTEPASDTHTHTNTHTEFRSVRPTFFQNRNEGTSSNKSAKRLLQQGSVASGRPLPRTARLSKRPSGVSPQRAFGPPGNSLNFQGGDVRHRPPAPDATCAPGGSERPARAAAPPSAGPRRPSARGPALGAPRPHLHRRRRPRRDHCSPPPRTPPGPPQRASAPAPASGTRRRAAVPGAPRAPLPSGAAPRPGAPQPSPGPLAETQPPRAPPTPPTEPCRPRPSPGLRRMRAGAHTPQPGPATRAPRRPEPPPSAPDSPGHPRTDPHTGAIFRSQAPARPELVQSARVRTVPTALCVPPPGSPLAAFPLLPL